MAIDKVTSASIATDAVGPTQLNEASNYDFTGTVTGAGAKGENYFKARNASATATLTHGASVLLPYDTEEWDPDGVYDNTASNYKFTCQKAGYHYFEAGGRKDDNNFSRQLSLLFYKNGSSVGGVAFDTYNNDHIRTYSVKTSIILNLSVNDYVQVYMYQTQSDSGNNSYSGNINNTFAGYRLPQ